MSNEVVNALEQAPLGQLVEKLGLAIANAQSALDRNSIELALAMANPDNAIELGGERRSLLSLGFSPTFYQVTETTIEIKLSFSLSRSVEWSLGASVGVNVGVFAASVNASYANKYSFKAEGSSAVTSRFVTVPPPTLFHDLLRAYSGTAPTTTDT